MVLPAAGRFPGIPRTVDTVSRALTPGDPGDLKATVGGVITNIKPGRIDARVRGLSTTDSDNSATLLDLIAEAASTGAELDIPEGVYNAAVSLGASHAGARITGRGVIRGVDGGPPVTLTAGANGLSLSGLTLDGAEARSGLITSGSSVIDGMTLRCLRFRNTATSGSSTNVAAIRDQVGMTNTTIVNCVFEDSIGGGIVVLTPNNLQILGNRFEGTAAGHSWGNFVYVAFYGGKAWGGGDGIVIANNVGVNGGRMAVELWHDAASGGPHPRGAVIADNWFDVTRGGLYGISIDAGRNTHVEGNTTVGTGSYGLEIIGDQSIVDANTVYGFGSGIILNDAARSRASGNMVVGSEIGIHAVSKPALENDMRFIEIVDNTIIDPIDDGIRLQHQSGGASGYERIERNLIWRSQVSDGDDSRIFSGIWINVGTQGPRLVRGNRIVQAHATPTLSSFRAIHATGTNAQPTRIVDNHFINLSESAYGTGIHGGSGATSLGGMEIRDNHFINFDTDMNAGASLVTVRGTASSASGSVGNVAGKIQVFDETGDSLGYVPVYDAIS